MKIEMIHRWNLTPKEAISLQKNLKKKLIFNFKEKTIRKIGGTDVSYSKKTNKLYAAIIIFSYPDLQILEESWFIGAAAFPYIPGLLSFREVPPLIEACRKLKNIPDLIICDGQGIAHPRGIGLASHLGLLLNIPSIGCAKSKLVGENYENLGTKKGDFVYLFYKEKKIGAIVRTKDNVKPLYVSPGYKIDIDNSINIVLSCCKKYRLPETTRVAHNFVNKLRIKLS
ncbi:deoxyribonuclease V [candidate division KSB1 bacterium]|nr:MAG: deoxyribonuclease V [candidate division KSB1 bacterium]